MGGWGFVKMAAPFVLLVFLLCLVIVFVQFEANPCDWAANCGHVSFPFFGLGTNGEFGHLFNIQKNPRAHKIKPALPPPPKTGTSPPKTRNFMDMEVFLQKEGIFPGVRKIGAAISGPRIADTNFADTRIYLKYYHSSKYWEWKFGVSATVASPHQDPLKASDRACATLVVC